MPLKFKQSGRFKLTKALLFACGITAAAGWNAHAETVFSVYGGANFSPSSKVDVTNAAGAIVSSSTVKWDGASFTMPPYYGVRLSHWLEEQPQLGLALDFTHAKVKASPLPAGLSTLEFTDGINFLTANVMYRHQQGGQVTPYGGIGAGFAIPHVEIDGPLLGNLPTHDYQVTGIAAQAFVGVDIAINERWSIFGEFKSTFGVVEANLKGGGNLSTDVLSNQVIVGLSYKFN